jgi:hypothetical protein
VISFFFQIKMANGRQKKAKSKKLTKKQQQLNEITKICKENFIEKDGASYRKDNLKLAYTKKGHCLKGDCKYREKKIETIKILVPPHLRKSFLTLVSDGTCLLPEDKIGQVVICLPHFFLTHQKYYLENGKLPEDAKLIGRCESKKGYEGEKKKAAKPYKRCEHGKVYTGWRISMTKGLNNTDWANTPKTLDASQLPPQSPTLDTLEQDNGDASPDLPPQSLSPADAPHLPPQSPAPSSSRGDKRKEPTSSRRPTAKRRR